MQRSFQQRVQAAAASARNHGANAPRIGLILGSGLSDLVDQLVPVETGPLAVSYGEIDGFGATSVTGHRGTLYLTPDVAVMAGRFHFYEGRSIDDVVLPVAMLCALGIRILIVTNAAGGINPGYQPGDLVLIRDHINLMGTNPLIGPKDPESVARFPDMTEAYSAKLRTVALDLDAELKEGVYVALTGPTYETPAEIRMLGAIGADLVGMSTVPEVIVARSYGVEVLGISTVTNLAAGLSGKALDHSEVVEVGHSIHGRMTRLLSGLIDRLAP
ncbi:MAG: purine-nucleoside phosphorylase [Spirochaetia bacterium]